MDGQQHTHGAGLDIDIRHHEFGAARRALGRPGQATLEFFEQNRIRGLRLGVGADGEHGAQHAGHEQAARGGTANRHTTRQLETALEDLCGEDGCEQQHREHFDKTQGRHEPARHDDQPQGLVGIDRATPAEAIGIPRPGRDSRPCLHDRVRRIARVAARFRETYPNLLERDRRLRLQPACLLIDLDSRRLHIRIS